MPDDLATTCLDCGESLLDCACRDEHCLDCLEHMDDCRCVDDARDHGSLTAGERNRDLTRGW